MAEGDPGPGGREGQALPAWYNQVVMEARKSFDEEVRHRQSAVIHKSIVEYGGAYQKNRIT